jgi:hypothetical protein
MSSQPSSAPPRLGNLLVERGYLTVEDLEKALAAQHQGGKNKLLGEILVDMEFCTEDHVVECLAVEYGVPYAKLEARLFDRAELRPADVQDSQPAHGRRGGARESVLN